MISEYTFRLATTDDINKIVEFTISEAKESQGSEVDINCVERGVSAAFIESPKSCYWVLEDTKNNIIANVSIVKEWSDFYGGDYWWIQSFYIIPEQRGRGISDYMMECVANQARSEDALEIRLYVHESNKIAISAYKRCVFSKTEYIMFNLKL